MTSGTIDDDQFLIVHPLFTVVDAEKFNKDGSGASVLELSSNEFDRFFLLFTDDDLARTFLERMLGEKADRMAVLEIIAGNDLRQLLTELEGLGCKDVGIDLSLSAAGNMRGRVMPIADLLASIPAGDSAGGHDRTGS